MCTGGIASFFDIRIWYLQTLLSSIKEKADRLDHYLNIGHETIARHNIEILINFEPKDNGQEYLSSSVHK
jgi:hypothetical protein